VAVYEFLMAASGTAESARGNVDSELQAARSPAQQWEPLVARYPWPVAEALSVLRCESEGDAAAYRDGNYGLFQINAIHAWRVGGDLSALFDPATNVRVAFEVWRDNAGWGPWACEP
jgi:soluble lytic murein transglycosylase-like protein